jgi:hypothetical protein
MNFKITVEWSPLGADKHIVSGTGAVSTVTDLPDAAKRLIEKSINAVFDQCLAQVKEALAPVVPQPSPVGRPVVDVKKEIKSRRPAEIKGKSKGGWSTLRKPKGG